jgi:hypothetical protein
MIEIASLAGLAAFVAASFVVGTRILMLAARTRRLPEVTIGASLFLAGGIGTALAILPQLLPSLGPDTSYIVYELGSITSHVGFCLLFVFVWRVFRPRVPWAAVLFVLLSVMLFAGAIGMAIEHEPGGAVMGRDVRGDVWFWSSLGARFVGYGWAAIETFRYYAMMKKRLALGLAEEAVTSRFYYWGVCTSAVVVIWISAAARDLLAGSQALVALVEIVTPLMGFVVAGSLWLAFFPRRGSGLRGAGAATLEDVGA